MNTKKIFLTSAITLCTLCPAFADTFPNDGNMLENKTYTNAATYTNTGVYEGSVNASATYSDNQYTVTAGHYLPAASEDPTTTCTAGNYCPGLQSQVYYNANSAQGLNACPSGYTNSATGSTANTDCYRSCVNSDITHATAITGNVYYNGTNGDGTKACTPTTCENGYHVNAGAPDLTTLVGVTQRGLDYALITVYGSGASGNESTYGLTSSDRNKFALDFGNKGVIYGYGRCSTRDGTHPWSDGWSSGFNVIDGNFVNDLTDESENSAAQSCYCKIDSYKPSGGSAQSASTPWAFVYTFTEGDDDNGIRCDYDCSYHCKDLLLYEYNLDFRAAMFNLVESGPASCDANTITITWADVDPATAGQNNEGTATYGGNINTPFKAATKPGKTFVGWKFVKQQ